MPFLLGPSFLFFEKQARLEAVICAKVEWALDLEEEDPSPGPGFSKVLVWSWSRDLKCQASGSLVAMSEWKYPSHDIDVRIK